MRLLPLLLILGGCAAPHADSPSGHSDALSRELAGRTAGAPEQCIPALSQTTGLVAIDRRTLVYRQGRTIWVNRLEAECPGLDPNDTLIVELHGSQYCRNDLFRTMDAGARIPGPTCRLGDFVPYRR